MGGLSKREQRLAEEAWWRYQTQGRPAPVPPPESVLANDPYPAREPIEVRQIDPTGETLEMHLAWERHRDVHPDGQVVPGSFEEERLIEEMNERRTAEIADNKAPRGVLRGAQLVSLRPRGGRLISIYRVARNRFVEVGGD